MPTSEDQNPISRRSLIQAAGGISFLALAPKALGEFAPTFEPQLAGDGPFPLFTALPYLQPGPLGSKLVDGAESIVIAWQTNGVKADYELTYGELDFGQKGKIVHSNRLSGDKSEGEQRTNFVATLTDLKLGRRYRYRVAMNGSKLFEGFFTTRKPRGTKTRFVAFGDNSYGEISDRAIAFQAYQARPDFVMNTGDNVYESGLDNEYARYFFPVYNADEAGQRLGAPLLRSVPFYTVIANHDVHGKDAEGVVAADFTKTPDALAYYTNMHLPLNGPDSKTPTRVVGPAKAISDFKEVAHERFPRMANYSFDYGDAHILCLDSNTYVDPTSAVLQEWVEADLSATDAAWKFVVFHHPGFNVGEEHYHEQHMRVLSPLFEKHKVDIVLHGHEHTYQRTKPLRFAPQDDSGAKDIGGKDRLVPGTFTVDTKFDGKQVTKPAGILYITTGAGGKHLYDPQMNADPKAWLHEEDDNVSYLEKFVSDRHSLTVIDLDAKTLTLRQVDEWGKVIDRILVTK